MAGNPRPQIRHYTLDDVKNWNPIGEGGQASVLVGKIKDFGQRLMAIKLFMCTSEDQKREIEILIQNPHPNIVQVFGVLCNRTNEPVVWTGYIMEYVKGGSLQDVIYNAKEVYSLPKIYIWIAQIAVALQFLHTYDIIHRDIKPANILVAGDLLKLADFGLARNIDASTTAGAGTHRYMAPEVITTGRCSTSSDVYSLATTIWEIFHRKIPYHEDIDIGPLLLKIIKGTRPLIAPDKMDEDVAALIQRCWQQNPQNRPSIREIIEYFETRTGSQNNHLDVNSTVNELLDRGIDVSVVLEQPDRDMNELQEILTALMRENGIKQDHGSIARPIGNSEAIAHGIQAYRDADRKTILVLGGVKGDEPCDDMLLLRNGQWITLSLKMPKPSDTHGTIYLNGEIYIFGGNLENHAYKLQKNLKWSRIADMERYSITNSCIEWKEKIWVIGGISHRNGGKTLDSVVFYEPKKDKWKETCFSMNTPRALTAATLWNNKFMVISGYCEGNYLKTFECFDLKTGVWTELQYLSPSVVSHAVISYQDELIIMGGADESKKVQKSVQKLTMCNGEIVWKDLPSMKYARQSFSTAILNDELYVIGGWNGTNNLVKTEIFNGKTWREGPDLPIGNRRMSALVIPQSLGEMLYNYRQ